MKKLLAIAIAATILAACSDEMKELTPTVENHSKGVFVCNEGNFMYGNASLSFYDVEQDKVQNQVFYNTNNVPLGDVCQSMVIRGNRGFVVVNNSGKVYVIDVNTFKHIATIDKLTSPRYIEFLSDTKAYISDLYSPSIAIVNPQTYKVVGSVHMGTRKGPGKVNGTEQMVHYKDFVYVCSWSFNNKVYKIDTRIDKVVDSITVGKQPNSMIIDKYNKVWVLSDGCYKGSPYGQENGSLTRFDAATFSIEKKYVFPTIEASPTRLCTNGAKDSVFFINGSWGDRNVMGSGIYAMNVKDDELPKAPLIPEDHRLFYGLAVDPETSEIYLSDAIDYVQRGWVFVYGSKGDQRRKFMVDIIPGSFCFRPKSAGK